MSPRWLRRGRPKLGTRRERPSTNGCTVRLKVRDPGKEVVDVLDALSNRYEVASVDDRRVSFRVEVDDARFPDEAVVRLACALDEIDADWQRLFTWPKRLD